MPHSDGAERSGPLALIRWQTTHCSSASCSDGIRVLKRPLSVLRTLPRLGMASLPAAHTAASTITAHAANASKYDELRNGGLLRGSTTDRKSPRLNSSQ